MPALLSSASPLFHAVGIRTATGFLLLKYLCLPLSSRICGEMHSVSFNGIYANYCIDCA